MLIGASSFLRVITCLSAPALLMGAVCHAAPQFIIFAPSDNISQPKARDFDGLAKRPLDWRNAAAKIQVFSITSTYLLRAPRDEAMKLLHQLSAYGLKLDVSLAALPVDKKVCGDGVEGMIWPHEAKLVAKTLNELGADVYSFSFDLPLSNGVISSAPKACRLGVREAAASLAQSVFELHSVYPKSRMMDGEVPTGMPVAQWSTLLIQWLAAYREETGNDFDGFAMDVWYQGNWKNSVRETVKILSQKGIPAGVIIDASEGPELPASQWIRKTKSIACELGGMNTTFDFFVIADWLDLNVPNLPETSPNTLTGLVDWIARPGHCTTSSNNRTTKPASVSAPWFYSFNLG